jgi:hypothetical protein
VFFDPLQLDVLERADAVLKALNAAYQYIPAALLEATGQELYAVVQGIIPAVLLALAIIACTTALGAAAGAVVGFLAGGVGAAPGAVLGAEAGFDVGLVLLNVLGIGFLVAYIGRSLLDAAVTAGEAVKEAWGAIDDPKTKNQRIDHAAHRFADAVALVFRGVLQGVVAFLLAKGTAAAASRVAELVGKLRASKIGAGFAEWVERNWQGLVNEPKLRTQEAAGGAGAESEAFAALKAAGEARRAQSYRDIAAQEKEYLAKEAAARAAGDNRQAGGYKAKVTEAVGERRTTEFMEKNHPDFVMDKGFQPGKGFDQVYTKYDAAGNPVEMKLVEAKGPGAELSTDAAKGPQMSKEWVENTVSDMVKSDDAATKALGKRLQDALDTGNPKVTGKVIQAVEGGGAREISLPNDNVYNGGRYN